MIFPASKCDDVSCSEVAGNLKLGKDPEYQAFEENLSLLKRELSSTKKQKKEAETLVKCE